MRSKEGRGRANGPAKSTSTSNAEATVIVEAEQAASEATCAAIARRAGIRVGSRMLPRGAWTDDDRRWFAARPARSHRVRPPLQGEMAACGWPSEYSMVFVRQTAPDELVRLPLTWNAPPLPDNEAVIAAVLDAIVAAMNAGDSGVTGEQMRQRVTTALAMPSGRA